MKSYVTTIIGACLLGISPAKAEDSWKPATEVKIEKIDKALASLKDKEPATLRQPTILAYKTAVFLATGAVDTPTIGKTQSICAKFQGGEEKFDRVVVTIEFMGYADDSLIGERFVIGLLAGQNGVWKVTKIERSAYGRGDHK
ncbi:MAG: hypothetical protein NTW21_44555 [Verrucomicrobia bacterium]|nr:hypothetical protein [Verrucomicrobiota bacterium]